MLASKADLCRDLQIASTGQVEIETRTSHRAVTLKPVQLLVDA